MAPNGPPRPEVAEPRTFASVNGDTLIRRRRRQALIAVQIILAVIRQVR
jgi:hypothetical protein